MFISHYNGHGIKLVRPLSTVDYTRDYARVSHSRQWSNYNVFARWLQRLSFKSWGIWETKSAQGVESCKIVLLGGTCSDTFVVWCIV